MNGGSEKRILITLLTKGAVNYFHNAILVRHLQQQGCVVTFFANRRTLASLQRLQGCGYEECDLRIEVGLRRKFVLDCLRTLRFQFPAADVRQRRRNLYFSFRRFSGHDIALFVLGLVLARFRCFVHLCAALERVLLRGRILSDIVTPARFDKILAGGFGQWNSVQDGHVSLLSAWRGIPCVNAIINYDGLSIRGFGLAPVSTLLVWGKAMEDEACRVHGFASHQVRVLGSLRYNCLEALQSREDFLRSQGLDPRRKTIVFCGGVFSFHYFEVLKAFDKLVEEYENIQLVIRPYPNQQFFSSTTFFYLKELVQKRADVVLNISLGDCGQSDIGEFMSSEEMTYWHYMLHSDVIIQYFSSVAIDSLVFEKCSLCFSYYDERLPNIGMESALPLYHYLVHQYRLQQYDIVQYVHSLDHLMERMRFQLENGNAVAPDEPILAWERGRVAPAAVREDLSAILCG